MTEAIEDKLTRAIEIVRKKIFTAATPKAQLAVLWAGALHARKFADREAVMREFISLAGEAGLTDGPRGRSNVIHVLQWAALGMNPFESGTLHDERD